MDKYRSSLVIENETDRRRVLHSLQAVFDLLDYGHSIKLSGDRDNEARKEVVRATARLLLGDNVELAEKT